MVNVIALKEFREHIRSKQRAVVGIKQTRQCVMGDEFLQVHG